MSNQILVPALGESVTEATVSKWLKKVGEKVDSDEPLVELETDKVNIEVPSPLSGVLSSIKVKEGNTVEVGALLGVVKDEGSNISKTSQQNDQDEKEYEEKKINKKKNQVKKIKETKLEKEDTLELSDVNKEKSNERKPLVLDTLVENEEQNETEETHVEKNTWPTNK